MKQIFVVDDNKDITDLMKLMLESSGYSCVTSNSGSEALSLMRNNIFDLVLLDMAMPEVTGIDVLDKVNEDPANTRNRIVLFTASSLTDSDIENFKKRGALDCIRKPITKTKLLETISKCLGSN
ncbi:MAG: response regulator [Nitrososphaerales archaeon]